MCLSVRALLLEPFDLYRTIRVKGVQHRSEGVVCLSVIRGACADDLADAVDRLLILNVNEYLNN